MQVDGPTVTSRVLAILATFSAERVEATLTEISRAAHIPLSSTHRLVGELVDWGALERADDGRYHVGLRLWELGMLAPRGIGLRDSAMPFLEDVYAATRQNVLLAVLDGTEAIYVERISAPKAVHVLSRAGTRMPLHLGGVGLVLLAHSPLQLRQQILAAPLVAFTRYSITDPSALRRILDDVRRQGFVVSDRQIEEVSMSIAAPVFDASGANVAAMSVVVPAGSDWRALAPTVVTAARGLSRALGAPTPARPRGALPPHRRTVGS